MSYKIFDQNVFIAAQDSPSIDAFDRLRVSNPVTLFDSQLEYNSQPLLWITKTNGTANTVHLPFESSQELNVGTSNGDFVIVQSREYIRYQPGKSQMVLCTGVLGAQANNCQKLIGYGDDENGVFFGQDGGGLFVLLRSNTSGTVSDERKIYSPNWNKDPMNGLGSSQITLDPTKSLIFFFDIEWLGVGRIRAGVVIDGIIYYVHQFVNANIYSTTYMKTANLPVRYEIRNTDDTQSPNSLKQICAAVISEGGVQETLAYPFSAKSVNYTMPNGEGNAEVIFAIRHAGTFNGLVNRGKFEPVQFDINATGGTIVATVLYNPTITGGSWGSLYNESFMEGNSTAGTGFSGGIPIEMLIVSGGNKGNVGASGRTLSNRLPFGLDIDGNNPITLALVAYGTAANIDGDFTFRWREIR